VLFANFIIVVVRGNQVHQAMRFFYLLPSDLGAPCRLIGGKFLLRAACHYTNSLHIICHLAKCRYRNRAFCHLGIHLHIYVHLSRCKLLCRACCCLSTLLHTFCRRATHRSPHHLSYFQTTSHHTLNHHSRRIYLGHASFLLCSHLHILTHLTRIQRQYRLTSRYANSLRT